MTNLKELQEKLNSDEKYQSRFLKDPVGIFKKEGINLSPEMEKDLNKSIKDLKIAPDAPLGSSLKKGRGVMISITIRF